MSSHKDDRLCHTMALLYWEHQRARPQANCAPQGCFGDRTLVRAYFAEFLCDSHYCKETVHQRAQIADAPSKGTKCEHTPHRQLMPLQEDWTARLRS